MGFYYGFIHGSEPVIPSWRARMQSGSIILFLLAIALSIWSRQERDGLSVIAEWVTPYPNVDRIMLVPSLSKEYAWGWVLDSPDSADEVITFYQDEQNTVGWEVTYSGRVFVMKRPGLELLLLVREKTPGSGLYYQLKNRE